MSFEIQRLPRPVYDDTGVLVAAQDWLGSTFRVGDRVIYCITSNPGGRMAIGVVTRLEELILERGHGRPDWREVRVQVRTERTSESYDFGKRARPAWVTASNITALPIELPLV